MADILYQNFDLIFRAHEGVYRLSVASDLVGELSGDRSVAFAPPFAAPELETLRGQLRRVSREVGSTTGESGLSEATLKDIGRRLFESTFQGEVLAALRSSLDKTKAERQGLRIRLHLGETPELAELPWEYLFDAHDKDDFLNLSIWTPVVRYLAVPHPVEVLNVAPPLKVLAIAASPKDHPALEVAQECRVLEQALAPLEERQLVQLELIEGVTLERLQRKLLEDEFHILHFIGHGDFDRNAEVSTLLFEDEEGFGDLVSSQVLKRWLSDEHGLRLVLLNACKGARGSARRAFSGLAQTLVASGVPAVIAMQVAISDQAAITFAKHFYKTIAVGSPVDAAVGVARMMMASERSGTALEWGTPVLFMRSPDGTLWTGERGSWAQVVRENPAKLESQPPVGSAPPGTPPKHNLPSRWNTLVGRADDLAKVADLLAQPSCRLLTLLGPGGVGKSRLALECAYGQLEHANFEGLYFVALEALASPASLPAHIAAALDLVSQGQQDALDEIAQQFGTKRVLLVLDNFEHLLQAAPLAAELLHRCSGLKLLVSSRERLGLAEEWLYSLSGLAFPAQAVPLEEAESYGAVALFCQSARRFQQNFALDIGNLPHVLDICRLLGGLPLGLQLAAVWVRLMDPKDIAAEIKKNFDFLSQQNRDASERHRSLRAVFEHSWSLMSESEQVAFRDLSVFRGGFDREAAQAVTGTSLLTLASLLDASLLYAVGDRYERLPMIYQYAQEKLAEHPDVFSLLEEKHSHYYLSFLQRQAHVLRSGERKAAQEAVLGDFENIRKAWLWAAQTQQLGLLAGALTPLFHVLDASARFREGEELFGQLALHLQDDVYEQHSLLARAWVFQALFAYRLAAYEAAAQLAGRGLEVFRGLGQNDLARWALNVSGAVAMGRGAYEEARDIFQDGLNAAEDDAARAQALNNVAAASYALADYEKVENLYREALRLYQRMGHQASVASSLNNLATVKLVLEHYDEAQRLLHEGLELARAFDLRQKLPPLLNNLARLACETGDAAKAQGFAEEALALTLEGDSAQRVTALTCLGRVATLRDEEEEAQRYFEEGLKLAWDLKHIPLVLTLLCYLADLRRKEGRVDTAAQLLTLVINHESTRQEIRTRAQAQLAGFASLVSAEGLVRTQEDASAKLNEVVAQELGYVLHYV